MQHTTFGTNPTYKVAILIKESSFIKSSLYAHYVSYLELNGVKDSDIYAVGIPYAANNKATAASIKINLEMLIPSFLNLKTEFIYCADSTYFKTLTGQKKPDQCIGYVYNCIIKGAEHIKVVYGLNHSVLIYNPVLQTQITMSLDTLIAQVRTGVVTVLGQGIIHSEVYPSMYEDIRALLKKVIQYPELVIDIEAFSLSFFTSGIGSIAFAWDEHNGMAFLVDYFPTGGQDGLHGFQHSNVRLKTLLRKFFEAYKGKLVAHNANFDFKVMIYNLWMEHPLDYVGMRKGIEVLTRLFDDTIVIAYLALNTTADFSRSLKDLAHEFTGKYAQDEIKTICRIPPDELLRYNLTDCLATFYVFKKYLPVVVQDNQFELYETLMKDSIKLILEMELVGMPMSDEKIDQAKTSLVEVVSTHYDVLAKNQTIHTTVAILRQRQADAANAKLKNKNKTAQDFIGYTFNPNSNQHVQVLLYEIMQLPVIELTKSRQPSVGAKTLKKLLNHTTNPVYLEAIQALLGITKVAKILSSFIPAFENGTLKANAMRYLHGSFHIGGTVSGRLSSCVAEWTEIATQRGMIPINQIRIGDMVWTHKRRWQPVLDVILKPITPMVDIVFCNGYTLTCTTAHKLRLPNGEWKTVQEIIDERIQNVDAEPQKRIGNSCSVQSRPSNNSCRDSSTTQYDQSQHYTYSENAHAVSRVCSEESPQIFNIERGGQESYEGQDGGTTPQMDRGVFGSQRLSNNTLQWGTAVCSPRSNGRSFGIDQTSRSFRSASCRQQPIEQRLRQLSFSNKSSTLHDSFPTSDECYGKIKEINTRCNLQVWDITVAEDHSYWAQGCFNHNSNPNMQNLPSGSTYGKLVKSCFVAPKGWLMAFADFSSLEDRIGALVTKDPNKLKVYMGHIVYKVMIDGVCHHIRDDDTIVYRGKTYTGEQFYETYCTL